MNKKRFKISIEDPAHPDGYIDNVLDQYDIIKAISPEGNSIYGSSFDVDDYDDIIKKAKFGCDYLAKTAKKAFPDEEADVEEVFSAAIDSADELDRFIDELDEICDTQEDHIQALRNYTDELEMIIICLLSNPTERLHYLQKINEYLDSEDIRDIIE